MAPPRNVDAPSRLQGVAQALDRANAYVAQRRATARLARSEARLTWLAHASEILASSLDSDATIDAIARLAVPSIAEWCVIELVGLNEKADTLIRDLSGGQTQRLYFALAVCGDPELLFLDEPSQGLAPLIVQDVFRVVVAMRNEGISVLLVEQNVRAAVEVADRAYVLDDGRIVFAGDRQALEASAEPAVRRFLDPARYGAGMGGVREA